MPESYQYIRNIDRLGTKISNIILVYFYYHTELKPRNYEHASSYVVHSFSHFKHWNQRLYGYLFAHFMFKLPTFILVYIRFM